MVMNWIVSSQNSYVETLDLNIPVFKDRLHRPPWPPSWPVLFGTPAGQLHGPECRGSESAQFTFFRGFPQDTLPAIPESLWYSVVFYLWLRLKKKVRDTTCKFKLLPAQDGSLRRRRQTLSLGE